MFKVLKTIGMELSLYHGGSLNGEDMKKVMNNATYDFDQLASLFIEGKRLDCVLLDDDMSSLCLHFRKVFVLWNGTFLLARMIDPTNEDIETYQKYIDVAVQGHMYLEWAITPEVHLMVKHVMWQMKNIRGGIGDKMEDWVEWIHQDGIYEQWHFWTVKNPEICTSDGKIESACVRYTCRRDFIRK